MNLIKDPRQGAGKVLGVIRAFIREHVMLVAMLLITSLICIGLIYYTGLTYMPDMLLYSGSLVIFYFLFANLAKRTSGKLDKILNIRFTKSEKTVTWLSFGFLGAGVVFIIYHLIYLKNIPVWTAYNSLDYYGIALIRQGITEHHNSFIHYTSSFLLKAILPFLVLFFFIKKRWLFWILLPIAIFYAMAMMQKGLVVSQVLPLIVFLFIKRRYILSGVFILVAVAGVLALIVNASPNLRASEEDISAYMAAHRRAYVPQKTKVAITESMASTSNALFERIVFTTGRDVGRWFTLIPSQLPYANGCGYRFLAPVLGCDSKDYEYDRVIWDNLYIVEYNEGLRGTVTSAYFMYDYANFGKAGLVLAGFLLAFVFVLLKIVFEGHAQWLASLNILYTLWLSNVALYSLLLSGGWVLTILLFWLFRPALETGK
ncbi:MAG: hypothetical protein WCM76_11090 [Bacteroidota bacterium]